MHPAIHAAVSEERVKDALTAAAAERAARGSAGSGRARARRRRIRARIAGGLLRLRPAIR
jgi:hypothetical protein